MEEKLRPTMLDPSLLCIFEFWELSTNLQDFFPVIYFPQSIAQIEDRELQDFYGGYRWGILSVDEMVRRSQEAFKPFSWKDYSEEVPQELRGGFEKLRRLLEESILPKPILHILLDEFVFLATQSSILSRLKKAFVLFENFDAIPLLNLERKIPWEWRKSMSGIKRAVSFVNWIAAMGVFSLWLGPLDGPPAGATVMGIRLLLIDPR